MRAVIAVQGWLGLVLGLVLIVAAVLLVVWWRQQSYRWPLVLAGAVAAALALSWWSGVAFNVADYRAGCDGLCPGFAARPSRFTAASQREEHSCRGASLLNSLVYLVPILGWAALVRALVNGGQGGSAEQCIDRRGVYIAVGGKSVVAFTAFSAAAGGPCAR